MNILQALDILEIDQYNFNRTQLKKAYLKQALLYHPDKSGNTPYNTQRFQTVKDAYDLLIIYADKSDEFDINNNNKNTSENTYNIHPMPINPDVLYTFIHNVLGGKYMNTVIDIVLGITEITTALFEDNADSDEISIETINKIKHFVNKYKEHSAEVSTPTTDETVNTTIYNYVLHPSIDDLLDDNIYKLNINNSILLVPLWHHECIYEHTDGKDITVNCIPILPKNIYIDEKNNIYTSISISLNNSLLNEIYYMNIGKKKYTIPINTLYIQSKPQQICLYNCGILEMTDLDLYTNNNNNNILIRSNIYVTITLI